MTEIPKPPCIFDPVNQCPSTCPNHKIMVDSNKNELPFMLEAFNITEEEFYKILSDSKKSNPSGYAQTVERTTQTHSHIAPQCEIKSKGVN